MIASVPVWAVGVGVLAVTFAPLVWAAWRDWRRNG